MSEKQQHSRWAVTATILFYMAAALAMLIVNKWVLVTTQTPLFFLFAQLLIAVLLFVVTHFLGLFTVDLKLDFKVCQQLLPMVALNVVGLRSVSSSSYVPFGLWVVVVTVSESVNVRRTLIPPLRIYIHPPSPIFSDETPLTAQTITVSNMSTPHSIKSPVVLFFPSL
jgi:hypothetical protein